MANGVFFVGFVEFETNSKSEVKRTRNRLVDNMNLMGDFLLAKMMVRTPYEFGELRRSGVVHPTEIKGNQLEMVISFGNEKVDYAVYVHERLDLQHASPTQAKFMESVIQEEESAMISILGRG